ncbi:MAG: hypothetical protein AAFX99_15290 [Myxococcota bacterium]
MAPVFDPVEGLEVVQGPLLGNLPSGNTAAFVQYDEVTRGSERVPSDHGNLPGSQEVRRQTLEFFRAWRDNGRAEIVLP